MTDEWETAQLEELMVLSCLACPKEKTLAQRQKYFPNTRFRDLRETLQASTSHHKFRPDT